MEGRPPIWILGAREFFQRVPLAVSGPSSILAALKQAVDALPPLVREAEGYQFRFPPGLPAAQVAALPGFVGVELPPDLKELYTGTYGAQLGEFWLLTGEEIKEARHKLSQTYGEDWQPDLLPFLSIKDTGDYLVLDLARTRGGRPAVLDGFHEEPPDRWSLICFGLSEFFARLVAADFEPYWLASGDGGTDD